MAIKKIIIDNSTQAKELDVNTIQLDLVAYPYNESNQKEPDAELRIFINNQLLQNLNSDIQWNIKENIIIRGKHEKINIKLQDITSGTISDVKEILLRWNTMKTNDTTSEKAKYIAQLKLNPNSINNLPERARNNSEIVKYALQQQGDLLSCVSENLKNDKEIVRIALRQNTWAFAYISDLLKTDEGFVVECLKKYWTQIMPHLSYYILSTSIVKKEIIVVENELKEKKNKITTNAW